MPHTRRREYEFIEGILASQEDRCYMKLVGIIILLKSAI
jgi:hypothetical protein